MIDQEMCNRYESIYTCSDSIVLLMKKFALRAVEVAQASFESLKEPI